MMAVNATDKSYLLKQSRQYSDSYFLCHHELWSVGLHGFFPLLLGNSSKVKLVSITQYLIYKSICICLVGSQLH